jgi:general secretion pathway protein G
MKMIKTLDRNKNITASGFTLVEILMVIMLIGLVMGALLKGLGGIEKDADRGVVEAFVNGGARAPAMAYKMKNGKNPSSMQDLAQYFDKNTIPTDPWGNPYQLKSPGEKNPDGYDIWSNGPDGQSNTGDDIGNW